MRSSTGDEDERNGDRSDQEAGKNQQREWDFFDKVLTHTPRIGLVLYFLKKSYN